jgi:hypothetical protein
MEWKLSVTVEAAEWACCLKKIGLWVGSRTAVFLVIRLDYQLGLVGSGVVEAEEEEFGDEVLATVGFVEENEAVAGVGADAQEELE